MADYLRKMVQMQKSGDPVGVYSACTGNKLAIEACIKHAKETNTIVVVESTANQVDQYGGYTGMKPADFMAMCKEIANRVGLPADRLILGGDHLGPLTFNHYEEEKAMEEASELVRQCVLAGYTKIHIDTSMKVASDDPETRLPDETIARRGAQLAKVAEEAYETYHNAHPDAPHPCYIIGSEVPIPGGSQDEFDKTGIQVTRPEDFKSTVKAFEDAYKAAGIGDAWQYVIGVVVQPGMEEKDAGCVEYIRENAVDLMNTLKEYPNLVFEGHSSDYQTKYKFRELVEDGVGILKTGPALTFALREGLFSLAFAERELLINEPEKQSHFIEVLDEAMLANPKHFIKHYYGTPEQIAFKRKYSFSDRCRYYFSTEPVEKAIDKLFENFKDGVPYGLLSQFMPIQYTKVRNGELENEPKALVMDRVNNCVDEYLYGSMQDKLN